MRSSTLGRGIPLAWSQIQTLLVLAAPRRPSIPGRARSAPSWGPQARPCARKGEAVPRAPQAASLPHLPARGASIWLAHPAASRSLVPAVAPPRRPHTPGAGRPVRLGRFAPRCDRTRRWASRRKVSSEQRGGTGRGGAGRRGGRKSAWRKGRGGGPCSPTGSRWGGHSQGPPPASINNNISY